MKIFICRRYSDAEADLGGGLFALAFNRGHAVKLLNKKLEERNLRSLTKRDVVEEIKPEEHKKGLVVFCLDD